jgi:hypothetical protein
MNEASSDAMKTIALASSSERPRRPIGTPVTRAALFSGVPVKRMRLAEYDYVIDAFTTDRPDQSFGECVLPRRAWGNRLVTDAHGS